MLSPKSSPSSSTGISQRYIADISVIVPAYNEERSVQLMIREVRETCDAAGVTSEIVIIDDGSRDDTASISRNTLKDRLGEVHSLTTNQGMGAAMRKGIEKAQGKWICFLPADGQFSPIEMLKLYDEHAELDAVAGAVGTQNRTAADSLTRVVLSFGMRLAMKLCHPNMPRFNGILLVDRVRVQDLTLVSKSGFVHMEILDRLRRSDRGIKMTYVPIEVRSRIAGCSKTANLKSIISILKDILKLRIGYNSYASRKKGRWD